MVPDFEYDPDKSLINKAKHGIDFEEARALWLDRRLLEHVPESAKRFSDKDML
jgi:hypothetical protein